MPAFGAEMLMEGSSQGRHKGEVKIHVDSIGVPEVQLRKGELITLVLLRVEVVLSQSECWNLYDFVMILC